MTRPLYRTRQFVAAVSARVDEAERAFVATALPAEQRRLFYRMSKGAQHHAIGVAKRLAKLGLADPDLLAAALLHDVGKGSLGLWQRIAVVLLEALWPEALVKLASPRPGSWRHGFWLQLHHEEEGARRAEEAGASPRVAFLIRHHGEAGSHDSDLAALAEADDDA